MKLHLLPALACARTFVDDEGTAHTTDGTPTIVTNVGDALSLEHMGLSHAQVIGTTGERFTSGSNYEGCYYDGNAYNAGGALDHNTAEYDPTLFPVDPISGDEAAMIAQSADLTPSCSASCFWCAGAEGEVVAQLDAHGWPDFLVQGTYGGGYWIPDDVRANATARGVPIIVLNSDGYSAGAEGGAGGYIEITQRFEELANFLGATADLSADKAALCTEVNTFKATAAAAAERGVRALAAYVPYGPVTDGATGVFAASATADQVTRMLEELGMQILHVDSNLGGGYFGWEYGSYDAAAVPYPVDFWLYDVRTALDFTSETFAADWPHPAVVAKQYAYWPSGGHVHSYQHAIDILQLVGEALGEANRLEDATSCTEVADVTDIDYRTNGLAPGEYACPQPVEYDWCEFEVDEDEDGDEDGDEDDWTDGPAGFCSDSGDTWLGETASREECIDACDEAGYEAMSWMPSETECVCFEWCDCISEFDAEDDCWCDGEDDAEEAMCASAGGEWECDVFGPVAVKGFPPPEVCDHDEDEDDDDCTPGWKAMECLDDGTWMYGGGCSSCDDCEMTYDMSAAYAAAWGGRYTCDPTTNTVYYDEDLDGNVDHEWKLGQCSYDACDDGECNIETSGDRSSSPSGTTNHGAGNGWCYSRSLRENIFWEVGCTASPGDCWERCSDGLGDDLVAIDWTRNGKCYCQNDCECMAEVGNNDRYLITRDSRVGALPHECGPGQGRWVEDWMWENSCRPEFCTSWGENSYDCCAIPENSPSYRNEPATCANGFTPTREDPSADDCKYTCCPTEDVDVDAFCRENGFEPDNFDAQRQAYPLEDEFLFGFQSGTCQFVAMKWDEQWATCCCSDPSYCCAWGEDENCKSRDEDWEEPTPEPTSVPTQSSVESPFLVTGDLTFEGMTYEAAQDNTDVFVAAVADLCGVAASAVTVEISEARRRRLAEGIVVTYTVGVATANEAQAVTSAISSSSTADVDAAISKARFFGKWEDFDGVTTTNVGTPTTTSSGDDGSSDGNGGADAASAGIIGGAVAGVAVLAAIGVGAYVYMRSKNSADSTQLAEVQLVGSADEAALPKAVASAPPLMPPPPPTGRNFCSACGAPLQGSFCSQCGARA